MLTTVPDCKIDVCIERAGNISSLIVHRALRRRQRGARWVKCEARINGSGATWFVLVEGESNSSILEERVKNDSATSEACGLLVTLLACSRM